MTFDLPTATASNFEELYMANHLEENYDMTEEDARRVVNDLTSSSDTGLAQEANERAASFLRDELDVEPKELLEEATEAKEARLQAREEAYDRRPSEQV